ncbi:MAG: 50S ribosomal protein L29 [Acidimicrobiia bacterium]|nr:50S ribosomal protein L29 [Acidimicrobiia bacterium]
MAKKSDLRDISDSDLLERLSDTKQELFNLRFQHVTGQLDAYTRLRQVRRDVARVNTELRAREIVAAEALAQEEKA